MSSILFSETVHWKLIKGLGSDLPSDYIEFLKTFDGKTPSARGFDVVKGDWGSGIAVLYTMQECDPYTSLLKGLDWQGLHLKEGLVPIGDDGCAGYILLSIRPEDYGSIHFCCTWTDDGTVDYYDSQGYWRIADSFDQFRNALKVIIYEEEIEQEKHVTLTQFDELNAEDSALIADLFATGLKNLGLDHQATEHDLSELWQLWLKKVVELQAERPRRSSMTPEGRLYLSSLAVVYGRIIETIHGWNWMKNAAGIEVVSPGHGVCISPFMEMETMRDCDLDLQPSVDLVMNLPKIPAPPKGTLFVSWKMTPEEIGLSTS